MTEEEKKKAIVVRTLKYQRKLVDKVCIECGKKFYQERVKKGICSEECKRARRKRFRPPTFKKCAYCGNSFGPVEHLFIKYCSPKCRNQAKVGVPGGKKGGRYPNQDRARVGICATCGKEYRAIKDFKERTQIYCSHRCYLKNRRVSGFENNVGDYLRSLGIEIEPQAKACRWSVDFQLIGTPILVEADGTFWHGSEEVKRRDRIKTDTLAGVGYEVHRISERDFKERKGLALEDVVLRWEQFTGKKAVRP